MQYLNRVNCGWLVIILCNEYKSNEITFIIIIITGKKINGGKNIQCISKGLYIISCCKCRIGSISNYCVILWSIKKMNTPCTP